MPAVWNGIYVLALIGIYMILLSAVAQIHLKCDKKKYYKNLVSVSLMRFTAKATTRNMCVVVLLLFVCCGSCLLYTSSKAHQNIGDYPNHIGTCITQGTEG